MIGGHIIKEIDTKQRNNYTTGHLDFLCACGCACVCACACFYINTCIYIYIHIYMHIYRSMLICFLRILISGHVYVCVFMYQCGSSAPTHCSALSLVISHAATCQCPLASSSESSDAKASLANCSNLVLRDALCKCLQAAVRKGPHVHN